MGNTKKAILSQALKQLCVEPLQRDSQRGGAMARLVVDQSRQYGGKRGLGGEVEGGWSRP